VVRDLVGTVWIDEQDDVLVHAEGHFVNDFKIGGGLIADIKKGSSFASTFTKVNGEVWLPSLFTGQGKVRFLLVAGFNGSVRAEFSNYRKFRTSSTIISTHGAIGSDGEPVQSGEDPVQRTPTGTEAAGQPKP
jgi:hypothetical protein